MTMTLLDCDYLAFDHILKFTKINGKLHHLNPCGYKNSVYRSRITERESYGRVRLACIFNFMRIFERLLSSSHLEKHTTNVLTSVNVKCKNKISQSSAF